MIHRPNTSLLSKLVGGSALLLLQSLAWGADAAPAATPASAAHTSGAHADVAT